MSHKNYYMQMGYKEGKEENSTTGITQMVARMLKPCDVVHYDRQ